MSQEPNWRPTPEQIDDVCVPGRSLRWKGDGRQYDRDTVQLAMKAFIPEAVMSASAVQAQMHHLAELLYENPDQARGLGQVVGRAVEALKDRHFSGATEGSWVSPHCVSRLTRELHEAMNGKVEDDKVPNLYTAVAQAKKLLSEFGEDRTFERDVLISRLQAAMEGELDGMSLANDKARAIVDHLAASGAVDDLYTHRQAWRKALEACAAGLPWNPEDASYWKHELEAFDRTMKRVLGGEIGDDWRANAAHLLDNCPHAIRVRPGNGPEDLLQSLVVTFTGMQHQIADSRKGWDRVMAEFERRKAPVKLDAEAELREILQDVVAEGTSMISTKTLRRAIEVLAKTPGQ
jgi:hypothetical protein